MAHPGNAGSSDSGKPAPSAAGSALYAFASTVIIIASLVVVVLLEAPGSAARLQLLFVLDTACCAYFWIEYLLGVRKAGRPWEYALAHLIDIAGAVPAVFALRWLRLIRLFRLLRILRVGVGLGKLWRLWIRELRTQPTLTLGFYSAMLVGLGAQAFYWAECGVNPRVNSYWDALWLAMATLTTVGYGDVYPVTNAGRVIGILLALLGIGFIASLTAAIAGHIMEQDAAK
jgi:voltage-gated potassium channel